MQTGVKHGESCSITFNSLTVLQENGGQIPMEVFLHRSLQHRNIIQLLDYFECGQSVILILERPESCMDLFDYISKQEFLPEDIARKIFRQVLDAALYCELKGVFHRDIKDENIILDLKTGEAKLADFGSGAQLHNLEYTEYEGKPRVAGPILILPIISRADTSCSNKQSPPNHIVRYFS